MKPPLSLYISAKVTLNYLGKNQNHYMLSIDFYIPPDHYNIIISLIEKESKIQAWLFSLEEDPPTPVGRRTRSHKSKETGASSKQSTKQPQQQQTSSEEPGEPGQNDEQGEPGPSGAGEEDTAVPGTSAAQDSDSSDLIIVSVSDTR